MGIGIAQLVSFLGEARMVIQMFVAPALLVALFVWFALEAGRAGGLFASPVPAVSSQRQAIAIVTQRYARGEIDVSEYERLVTAFTR